MRTHQFQLRASIGVQGLLAAVLIAASPAWAINKCTGADGKVVFQDAPCMGRGEKLEVRPASGNGSSTPRAEQAAREATPVTSPVSAQAATVTLPPAAPAPAKSALDRQAEQCLAWYKPLLRDPASAYYSEPKFEDKRVLRMSLHATNGFGGFVVRQAACEFDNGKFSPEWTKIQAKRLEWQVD